MCSEPTIKRLAVYHKYLKELEAKGEEWISCTKIANELGLIPIQVRKDLANTDILGKPKKGYGVRELLESLERFLCFGNIDALLIGAGHLGSALIRHKGFSAYGLNIKYIFDNDKAKIGKLINNREIFDIADMSKILKNNKIDIGILTMPGEFAQEIANQMISCGISAIWNFTNVRIIVPKSVVVKHENLAGSFLVLAKRLKNKNSN